MTNKNSSLCDSDECTPRSDTGPAGVGLQIPAIKFEPRIGTTAIGDSYRIDMSVEDGSFIAMQARSDFWFCKPRGRHMDLTLTAYAGRFRHDEEPRVFSPEERAEFLSIIALVEAAPDLLKALKMLYELNEAQGEDDVCMMMARDAIAKAEGGAS